MKPVLIEIEDLAKGYHLGRPNEVWTVRGVDLKLRAGEVSVFAGPSGSGKTSLLSLVGGLARPSRGLVRVGGEAVSKLPERFLTEWRRERFGFVFQQFNLVRGMSALTNVMLPAYPLGREHEALSARARALLDELGMSHRVDAKVELLSGGEQQRVAIARALINQPQVLIADEPTANLDSALAEEFLAIIGRCVDQGLSVLMSSHDPLVLASSRVDRVIELRDGRVAKDSSPV